MRWTHLRSGIPLRGALGAICAVIAMTASTTAQQAVRSDQTYLIDTWETQDGLPENSATAMAQTPDGYLWFGTFNGLVRFDGVRFTAFDPTNTPQLPAAEIINLHGDRRGRLWVSTSRGMAVREDGRWRALGAGDGWPTDNVRTFAERDNGDLLITTFRGEVFEFAGGRIVALPAPPGEPGKGYLGCVDDNAHWWVAQHRFVGSWDGQRWTSTVAMTARNPELIGCAQARGGGIWLLVEKSLRKYKRGVEESRVTLPELPGGLWSMTEDSRGNVWFASYGEGVSRVSPDGQMRRWTTTNGLVSASTRFVFEDREDNLWIGTSGGGLTRFMPRRVQSFGAERGLTERVVSSIWPGREGLWIATRGKGLFRLRDGVVTPVPLPIPNKVLIAQSVLTDRKGRVWLGTGQDLWAADADVFRRAYPDQLSGADIRALFEDSRGRLWIGAAKGTSVVDDGQLRVFTSADGLPARGAYAFAEDGHGVIWLSTRDGVFRTENGRFVELLDGNGRPLRNISCFKADTGEALWLGSRDEGLIYRTQAGRLARVPGLPVRAVNGILEDQAGVFWLASDRGVVRVNAQDLRLAAAGSLSPLDSQVLDLSDGLPGLETASGQPTSARDARGRLWFATSKGVAMIDPAEFRLNTRPPPVTLEQIVYHAPAARADGAEVRVVLPVPGPLRLPAGSHQIEVHYTALSFSAPDKVRFQVKLDGADDVWHDEGSRRVVSFYELPPAKYVFRVRAANNDGVWNDSGASLAFEVQPYFWQTTAFRLGLVLLLISTGGGIVWSVGRSKHRRELADLERTARQQKELAHLSRVTMLGELSGSMAHELNQPLAAILSNAQAGLRFLARGDADLTEVREILQDIVDQDKRAGEVIRRLRALLKKGEVHRQPLDVNDIAQEVLTLVESDLVNHGVTTSTDLAADLPMVTGDRVQLEQVLLNLVMNASDAMSSKPAGDRRLTVRTERSREDGVCVSVSDRGTGMAPDAEARVFEPFFTTKPQGLGLGLSVCRTIITAHGGTLSAANNPDEGATFGFTLPANGARQGASG